MLRDCYIYRVASSEAAGSPSGIWWFTQDIWDRCQKEAGRSDSQRITWLHKHLALCYDWSECDRIVRIHTDTGLPGGAGCWATQDDLFEPQDAITAASGHRN